MATLSPTAPARLSSSPETHCLPCPLPHAPPQVPRGEEHPTMFAVKDLDVKGPADSMIGDFIVPPYRGSSFMDPRGALALL